MTIAVSGDKKVLDRSQPAWLSTTLGLVVLAIGLGGAMLGHRLVPQIGVLTVSASSVAT